MNLRSASVWVTSIMFAVAAFTTLAAPASATIVSGALTTRDGTPVAGYQVHFENKVSGDQILAETGADGSFKVSLPPGVYDLREERGATIVRNVIVSNYDLKLGQAAERNPMSPIRLLQLEGIGEAVVDSPASSTANVRRAGAVMLGSRARAAAEAAWARQLERAGIGAVPGPPNTASRHAGPRFAIDPQWTDTSQPPAAAPAASRP